MKQTIVDWFEQIVRLYPNNLAVKMGDRTLTYEELNNAANLIAYAILEKRGPGSEPIALLFEDGIDGITALLGVSKAGKFYFALDNSSPIERNRYMLSDTQAALMITDDVNLRLAQQLSRGLVSVLSVDDVEGETHVGDPVFHASPDELFAISYTSGSTGLPKAVMQGHFFRFHETLLHASMANIVADDRLSLLQPAGFVGAEIQLFRSLYSGAALFPFDLRSEGTQPLLQWLRNEKITVWHTTPAVFRELSDLITDREMLSELRLIQISGAPIRQHDISIFKNKFSPLTKLIVHMGSTEAGAICSAAIDQNFAFPKHGAPVGYSFPGKTIVVLDEERREVAPGTVGEIAVKSRYLAAVYWKDSGLTGEKFLPDPTGGDMRTYLTGDLGRVLPDGFLFHLGRTDLMVKIRGNRVELGEIESALLAHLQVKDAGVSAWESEDGDKILAAYIVPRDGWVPAVDELRSFLATTLPDFMIPARFMLLESLPLINGKLNRRTLPKPDNQRPVLNTPYICPQSEIEKKLCEIWEEVLDIRPIGMADNFFELGGNSLTATRVISRVVQHFQCDMPLKSLFQSPTLAAMVLVILGHQGTLLADGQLQKIFDELESLSEKEAKRLLS